MTSEHLRKMVEDQYIKSKANNENVYREKETKFAYRITNNYPVSIYSYINT